MYRRAVESGAVEAREHACYTIIAGLRAASQGVPFMPLNGPSGLGSDRRCAASPSVRDPYSGQDVMVVPAIVPDVALIHVQEADVDGNARIWGSVFEDTLMARAREAGDPHGRADRGRAEFAAEPERTDVPGFLVEAVVEAPRGAWPTSCAGLYQYDEAFLAGWWRRPADDDALRRFVEGILHAIRPGRCPPAPEADAEGSRSTRLTAAHSRRHGGSGSRCQPSTGEHVRGRRPRATAEQMAVALARLLRDGETVFFGVASPLPMVAALLAQRLHAPGSGDPDHTRRRRSLARGAADLDGRSAPARTAPARDHPRRHLRPLGARRLDTAFLERRPDRPTRADQHERHRRLAPPEGAPARSGPAAPP